jgi:sulfide dehydrogenase cytochrome subunit
MALAWAARAGAADPETLAHDCDGCHGPGGVSTRSDIPSIAGRSQALLEKSLRQFRVMDRPCQRTAYWHGDTSRSETTMCNLARRLGDDEITALSQYYAAREYTPIRQPFDADEAVRGANLHNLYCESCHPAGGSEAGYAPRLAGQWMPYLKHTIVQIRSGELIVPHVMERKLTEFSEDEIDQLLNFWASQQD